MQIPKLTMNNGLEVPAFGLGTWELRGQTCIDSVKKALELGYTHFDTAEYYRNETEIGQAIKGTNREDLFITTKIIPEDLDYYRVVGSCEQALARLETSYIDLYLIHWPNRSFDTKEALKGFKALVDVGKIKSFGVSNYSIPQMQEALDFAKELELPIVTNQVEYHPYLNQKKLLEFCNNNNLLITSYSPLARGLALKDPIIEEIASKHNKTTAQIILKWLIDKNTIVIPKASSEKHLKDNLDIFNINLNNDDTEKLDTIQDVRGKNRIIQGFKEDE